jgi:putative FmdB family regulatory protein
VTYVFQCRSCKHEFEITATVAEYESRKAPACPRCGREESRRVFTPVLVMTAAGASGAAGPGPAGSGGGCGCGSGGCGCGH